MRRKTFPTLMDTARTIIARLFPQRSPARARSRPQKPCDMARRYQCFHRCAPARAEAAKSSGRRDKPRLNIPGSIWLPDTCYGKLAAATEEYLRRGIELASGGNKCRAARYLIYCQENCWMSWNAAKRILSYGYSNVAWYPEGTEGWERANLPVVDSRPLSRAEEGNPSSR
jgi:PQQ-dependent catabolism-associated CXXCW motif protein